MEKERCIKFKSIFFLTGLVFGFFFLPSGVEGYCNMWCVVDSVEGLMWDCCHQGPHLEPFTNREPVGTVNPFYCADSPYQEHVEDQCVLQSDSFGEPYVRACAYGKIPDVDVSDPDPNGLPCAILHASQSFLFCNPACEQSGVYDKSEVKCVVCGGTNNRREVGVLGTAGSIPYDPCNDPYTPASGDNQCESACGADSACDERSPEQSCSGGTCNSNCQCIATTTTTTTPTTTTTTPTTTTTTTTPATTTTTTPATTTTTVPECIVNSDCCFLASGSDQCVQCDDGECDVWSCLPSGGCYPTEADCGCPPPTTTTTTTTTSTTTTTIPVSPINPPSVETVGHENLAETSVTLKGTLTSGGGANICLVWFEYGTSGPPYASSTSYQTIINCNSVSFPYYFDSGSEISGLTPGTTYYFEAFAKNGGSW